jgi:uridine phosphorylase
VGTTGPSSSIVDVGDVVVTTAGRCADGASTHYAPIEFPRWRIPTWSTGHARARSGIPAQVGVSASCDTFYPGQERVDSFTVTCRVAPGRHRGVAAPAVLNYEMEAATLLTMTAAMGPAWRLRCGVVVNRTRGTSSSRPQARRAQRRCASPPRRRRPGRRRR